MEGVGTVLGGGGELGWGELWLWHRVVLLFLNKCPSIMLYIQTVCKTL